MAKDGKRRECPVDWTPWKAKRIERRGLDVVVDECPKCQGTFVDDAEVGRLTGNRSLDTFLDKYVGADADTERICPRCGGLMDSEQVETVRVDVCLTCKGMWVDHGELEVLQSAKGDYTKLSAEKKAELERAEAGRQQQLKAEGTPLRRLLNRLRGKGA